MINSAKKIFLMLTAVLLTSMAAFSQNDNMKQESMDMKSDAPAGIQMNDGMLYGKDYDPSMTIVQYSDFIKSPEASNGQTVLIKGTIAEVCQEMGCWMTMSDGTTTTRVKTGHEFFLPKDAAGQNVIVIGTFKITEISEEDARHYAEETKNSAVKPEDIKGNQKAYEIEAAGIKILNSSPSKN